MTLGMPKNPNFSARNSSLALSLAAFRHAVAVPPILPAAYGPTWAQYHKSMLFPHID